MIKDSYDIIVAGSGLGGMTAARRLAGGERRILLVEQHSQLGGLATYFKRRGHIFDVALHGFPVGMQKSLRKYWGKEFAQRVSQVRSIRFNNPQYQLDTTFDTEDFSAKLHGHFGVPKAAVDAFFAAIAEMNYYDQNQESTREFFQRHFPGRKDIWRFLMEPITYANGSTLDEPAISYGIVFGNFMSKGVYTFTGGTDCLIDMMEKSLREHGVQVECNAALEKIYVEGGRVRAARINGKEVGCRALVSNGSLPRTVLAWVGEEHFREEFSAGLKQLVLSNSSCQVYIGIKEGEKLPYIGDLLFDSTWPEFDSEALLSRQVSSRTYSVYYPEIRPGSSAYSVVASMNARHEDWAGLSREEYRAGKKALIEDSLDALSLHLPNIRRIADYVEAATPCTFERYTGHVRGATFGSKFPGLGYSMGLHQELGGLFHTGSVGIIMSGWLGAANYGVITANEVEKYLAAAAG